MNPDLWKLVSQVSAGMLAAVMAVLAVIGTHSQFSVHFWVLGGFCFGLMMYGITKRKDKNSIAETPSTSWPLRHQAPEANANSSQIPHHEGDADHD